MNNIPKYLLPERLDDSNDLEITLQFDESLETTHYKFNKGCYITNAKEKKTINSNYKPNDIKIKAKYMELLPESCFEKYDEIEYIKLKYEILEFNDHITTFLKRKGWNPQNGNLEHNLFIKYENIKNLEQLMQKK
jgi:hypothetical protein